MRHSKTLYFSAALICILLFWYGAGNLLTGIFSKLLLSEPGLRPGDDGYYYSLPTYFVLNIGFFALLSGTLAAAKYILLIPIKAFITDSPHVRIRRGLSACFMWIVLLSLFTVIEFLVSPGQLKLTLNVRSLLLFLPAALILVSIQAASEEFLFRTFLGRWIGVYSTRKLPASAISGILFMSVHLFNPEISLYSNSWAIYLFYFLFGYILMYFSLKDGGYELAIGIHVGNNLFSSILVNYEGSVMPTPSLFTAQSDTPVPALIFLIISSGIIYLVFLRHKKADNESHSVKKLRE
jgi:CAAX protease family protein